METLQTIIDTIKGLPDAFVHNFVVTRILDFINGTISDVEIIVAGLGEVDQDLLTQLKNKSAQLEADKSNTKLRADILDGNVELWRKHLGVTRKQAADGLRSATLAYAETQGIRPIDIINALTEDEKRILNYSNDPSKLFGVDLVTANKMAAVAARLSGRGLLLVTVLGFFIMLSAGPEAAVGMLGAHTIASLIARLGGKWLIGTTVLTFFWSQFFGHLATDIPMITKQLIDNGSIGPGLRIKAIEDVEKVKQKLMTGGIGEGRSQGTATERQPVTRITMAKTQKPTLFLGTLFSSIVKHVATFERVVDDKITDKQDLLNDAQSNLNKWLGSLPSRLIYTISIDNAPFDENGVRQTGTWATLKLGIKSIGGRFTPLDTILLGPVDPTVYMPKTQEITTIQNELPKLLTAEEIAQVQLPTGDFRLVDKQGNLVPQPFGESKPAPVAIPTAPVVTPVVPSPVAAPVNVAPAAAPVPPSAFAPLPAGVAGPVIPKPEMPAPPPVTVTISQDGARLITQEDYFSHGLAIPAGAPSRAAYEANKLSYAISQTIDLRPQPAAIAAAAAKPLEPFAGGPLQIHRGDPITLGSPNGNVACSNQRETASTKGTIISCFIRGTHGIMRNYAGKADGFDWYAVEISGRTGFVASTQIHPAV